MKQIKQIVEKLELDRLKEEYLENKEYLFCLERKMADLTFQYEVGWYAHRLDEMEDIIKKMEESSPEKKELLSKKLKLLMIKNQVLENIPEVILYKNTRELYNNIKKENNRYYKTLQKDFREELRSIDTIPYYVSQGEEKEAKHILFKEEEYPYADIYPEQELKSKREYRHFYNRVSYKYLESVSKTHSLRYRDNEVGKVKTLIP